MNSVVNWRAIVLLVVALSGGMLAAGASGQACSVATNFRYQVTPADVKVSPDFNRQMTAASQRMYQTWQFFLGTGNLQQADIALLLLDNPQTFKQLKQEIAPELPAVTGFYSVRRNQAVIQYQPDDLEKSRRTAIHEISHLVTANQLGPVPIWLTEGLAEYFEALEIAPGGAVVRPNSRHLQYLNVERLPPLAEVLVISERDWNGPGRHQNYAVAWSLVYFLMTAEPGRFALKTVISELHGNMYEANLAAQALASMYPGGLGRLESDWRNWLRRADFSLATR